MTVVGALGAGPLVDVDADGIVHAASVRLRVWIGDEERWRRCETEPSRRVRQHPAPVSDQVVALAGGDAHVRVFATGGGASAILEIENASAGPVVLGIVVEVPDGEIAPVDEGRILRWRGGGLSFRSAPRRHATRSTIEALFDVVRAHEARSTPMTQIRPGDHAIALFVLAHHQRWRARIDLGDRGPTRTGLAADSDATFEDVLAGWRAALARGMQVDLPDDRLQLAVDRSRAVVLVASERSGRGAIELARALEDWGFDDEAVAVWSRLGTRARRNARRRGVSVEWEAVRPLLDRATIDASSTLLAAMRTRLVRDDGRTIELLPGLVSEWYGAPLAVSRAPTRHGQVSVALRWHGDRPALLWDTPEGVTLRAPSLDPTWERSGGRGEALFEPVAAQLLRLTTSSTRSGKPVANPGSFA